MSIGTGPITIEEFDRIAALPENADRRLEYIGGMVVEVVSNAYASAVAAAINGFIFMYLRQNDIAHLTGADGGYQVSGERYIPDVGVILKARQPELPRDAYNPLPPDLTVEVMSPSDDLDVMRVKALNYVAAGTVVWLVRPEIQVVEVCVPGQPVQRLSSEDVLSGGDVLPGFGVAVGEVFP